MLGTIPLGKLARTALTCFVLALSLSACGGGGDTTPLPNTTTPLFTTAGASGTTINLTVGQTVSYTVGGGGGGQNYTTYSTSSTNINIASTAIHGTTFSITGLAAGTATIVVQDSAGNTVNVIASVSGGASSGGSSEPPFINAPAVVSLTQGQAANYTFGGGTGPYTAVSANGAIAIVKLVGNSAISVTAVSAGATSFALFDATGASKSIDVNVAPAAGPQALASTVPAGLTVAPGSSASFVVYGGIPPYTVTTANAAVSTAIVVNNLLTITGVGVGTSTIQVTDAVNQSLTAPVAVVNSNPTVNIPLYLDTPTVGVTLSANQTATYTVGGGTPPYVAVSSDVSAATTSVSGTVLTITGVGTGTTATVALFDATGAAKEVLVTLK